MKRMLIIKPSLSRLPQEHILHVFSVYKWRHPSEQDICFQAAGFIYHVAEQDTPN